MARAESCIDLHSFKRFIIVMKMFARLIVWMLAGMLMTGCSIFPWARQHPHPAPAPAPAAPAPAMRSAPPIVTPDNSLTARVAAYNATGRFVVLSFSVGQMPQLEQTLFLYRNGLKVAEVKVTGPQRDNNIVADLVTGDAQVGDEVRDQ